MASNGKRSQGATAIGGAVKRLTLDLKQLQEHPLIGANAAPAEGNGSFLTWYAVVEGPPGTAYAGIPIRFVMEFPATYPADPPNAFFETEISYRGGASLRDAKGRQSVCLDLFGNFRQGHGWDDGTASGWTPAYGVSSILLAVQALLMSDMLSLQASDVSRTAENARKFKCAVTGHDGKDRSKWYPAVLQQVSAAVPMPAQASVTAMDVDAPVCSTVASSLDGKEMKSAVILNNGASAAMDVDTASAAAAAESKAKAGHDEVKVVSASTLTGVPDILTEHYSCYCDKESVETGAILGYGVNVEKNGSLSSPCEYLSWESYTQLKIRCGTTNRRFTHWLPLYINAEHWARVKQENVLWSNVQAIVTAMDATQRRAAPEAPAVALLRLCCSLMNNMVVEVMNNQNHLTANDKFIDGYVALYHLMMVVRQEDPTVGKQADARVAAFMQRWDNRSKNSVPNLGDFLASLAVSSYGWKDIAEAFVEETDARNVFWYAVGTRNSAPTCRHLLKGNVDGAQRCRDVFAATQISRHLVCFQVRFLQLARSLTLQTLHSTSGLPPCEVRKDLKSAYAAITTIKDWQGHFKFLQMKEYTDAERSSDLWRAVQNSAKRGYHR